MGGVGMAVFHFSSCPVVLVLLVHLVLLVVFLIFFLTFPPARSPAMNCGYLYLYPEEGIFRPK
jgi:hypothetical protein